MDHSTINQIAYIRQQEILAETAQDREAKPLLRPALRQLGRVFVTIGHRLMQADSQPADTYPSFENEACI